MSARVERRYRQSRAPHDKDRRSWGFPGEISSRERGKWAEGFKSGWDGWEHGPRRTTTSSLGDEPLKRHPCPVTFLQDDPLDKDGPCGRLLLGPNVPKICLMQMLSSDWRASGQRPQGWVLVARGSRYLDNASPAGSRRLHEAGSETGMRGMGPDAVDNGQSSSKLNSDGEGGWR